MFLPFCRGGSSSISVHGGSDESAILQYKTVEPRKT